MKVYFTPVKLVGISPRLSLREFFDHLVKNYSGESDFKSIDKEVKFKFFDDQDSFIVIVLTIKDLKNFCEGDDTGSDFTWKLSGDLTNKIAETNVLVISKKNYAGAYLNNEGSVRLNTFESKLRWAFRQVLRNRHKRSKRDEKFSIQRLVDSADIFNKVSRLSEVDEINATFTNPATGKRMNNSIFKSAKSLRVVQRVGHFSLKSLSKRKEISDYLEGLIKDGCTGVSVKGTGSTSLAGETIGIADAVNSIYSMEYADYISSLNGISLSQFLSSDLFKNAKKEILSNSLVKRA
ncbi:hypothetical protein D884_03297 [Pseudomonas sp. URMO17WK12:I10]|uniref:hypothetical protein n=1 Tax=unclassified Pseudomonas TaxID=196821 RepID=UPI000483CF15|nr:MULTISPECIES: hypothetical protein [unclassified Pseudomonas]RDL18476.1 hypothetical protein F633_02842 [Pseudomonas sp. LAMO17WK12:I3]RED04034.1 hypothetical protein D884_03297 [Pseudomonas sp. URMO17WK12:I10]SOD10308.1 hypothetical protein SAMN05660967_03523 [Pseudomonas sp. URMO17WK12:I9]